MCQQKNKWRWFGFNYWGRRPLRTVPPHIWSRVVEQNAGKSVTSVSLVKSSWANLFRVGGTEQRKYDIPPLGRMRLHKLCYLQIVICWQGLCHDTLLTCLLHLPQPLSAGLRSAGGRWSSGSQCGQSASGRNKLGPPGSDISRVLWGRPGHSFLRRFWLLHCDYFTTALPWRSGLYKWNVVIEEKVQIGSSWKWSLVSGRRFLFRLCSQTGVWSFKGENHTSVTSGLGDPLTFSLRAAVWVTHYKTERSVHHFQHGSRPMGSKNTTLSVKPCTVIGSRPSSPHPHKLGSNQTADVAEWETKQETRFGPKRWKQKHSWEQWWLSGFSGEEASSSPPVWGPPDVQGPVTVGSNV